MHNKRLRVIQHISIHALRGEGDPGSIWQHSRPLLFLSTPSVGRATLDQWQLRHFDKISIHALRGEGDQQRADGRRNGHRISIHALRGEGDFRSCPIIMPD